MDQDQFRETYREMNDCYCAFEKSILTNKCACSLSHKFCIAEREGVSCQSEDAQGACIEILEAIRTHAKFALRTDKDKTALPHGKAIRIQVGGMRGLYKALLPNDELPEIIPDLSKLVSLAKASDFNQLPYTIIMQHIAAHKMKKRSRRRNKD